MFDMKIHHVGYAVKSIQDTAAFYIEQGWVLTEEVEDKIQNCKIAFLKHKEVGGGIMIELVASVDEKSPVFQRLKNGVGPYHVCYTVKNIDEAVSEMRKKKFLPLFKPVPAIAIDNKLICYLYNKNTGLIELVEE